MGALGTGQSGSPSTEADGTPSIAGVVGTGQVQSSSIEIDASAIGCTGSGQVASLAIKIDGAVVGTFGTGQPGSFIAQISVFVAGTVGTGQIGSPNTEVDTSPIVVGVAGTGQIGAILAKTGVSGLGVASGGQIGSPSIEIDASASGTTGLGHAGALTVEIDESVAGAVGTTQLGSTISEVSASGIAVVGSGQIGSPKIEVDASLTGAGSVGQVGSIVVGEGFSVAIAGVSSAGQLGSLISEVNISVAGAFGTGHVGSLDVGNTIAGSACSGQVGSPAIEVDVFVIGVAATASAGTIGIIDFIVVSLYSDSDGAPGDFIAIIGSFLDSDVDSTPTTITLTPDTPISLAVNTRYWVQVTNTNTTTVKWVTLDNDGGTGVAPEFWYKSTGDSGDNDSSPAYQMAVFVEETIGISGVAGVGQVGEPVAYIASVFGVEAEGSAGTVDIAVGALDEIIVSLYSDNDGVPGDFIEVIGSFYDAAVSTAPTTITLTPTMPIALAENTRYWVQVVNTLTTTVRWVTLNNDGGTGVAPEFWYKSTGDSGANDSSPAYQMAVFSEALIGANGIGQIGTLTIQFSSVTSVPDTAGAGQVGSLLAAVTGIIDGVGGLGEVGTVIGDVTIDNATIDGVAGTGQAGTAKGGRVSRKRSGRGADTTFTPALFSKPGEAESDVQAISRWRKIVDDLLDLPARQAEGTDQPEPDLGREEEREFAFLNALPKPRPGVEAVQPNWQAIAEADDTLLLGECSGGRAEADDLLLLGDWL